MKDLVTNCNLIHRKDDILFHLDVDSGSIHPTLNGYTVIPNECYEQMIKEINPQRQQEIFDCCLVG
jgi:hypothetical protein